MKNGITIVSPGISLNIEERIMLGAVEDCIFYMMKSIYLVEYKKENAIVIFKNESIVMNIFLEDVNGIKKFCAYDEDENLMFDGDILTMCNFVLKTIYSMTDILG